MWPYLPENLPPDGFTDNPQWTTEQLNKTYSQWSHIPILGCIGIWLFREDIAAVLEPHLGDFLEKIGPFLNSKDAFDASKTDVPMISEGIKSGVN
jgi:hypothetical protein